MTTALVSAFLFVHGLLHLAVWLPHGAAEQPFDPRHSWVLAAAGAPRARSVDRAAIGLASVTAMLYVIAGASAAAQSSGWTTAALLAAASGLLLKALWFDPWLTLGVLLDVGVIAAVLASWPGALF
ncbi:hypothetical protein QNN03_00410 [Streptomyces sp. GXMU-J15]|uniref:Uncharacterized protein n=1 Tax=Streptomyces fuscus TaxID=3048495 RepID=A0ABT7ITV5_9ACTN|nr:hypothetical protein [Streptomyces fuscus]MDL2074893.1 hypothetical protein [Streptomyces fuscus]